MPARRVGRGYADSGRRLRQGERRATGGVGYAPRGPAVLLALVASPTSLAKRLLLGRPFRSDKLQHTLLPKRIALPVFASDALSSVAYAPDEILLTLSIAGATAFVYSPWVTLAVAVVMVTVVASYRQNVHAYPSGGGDYEVATVNLGPRAGLGVASALLVDYILTVAVSTAAGVNNLGSVVPFVAEHKVAFAIGAIAVLTSLNLRGLRESGTAFAIPTYTFIIVIVGMVLTGLFRYLVLGDDLRAPSADLVIAAEHGHLTSFAFAYLLLRTFSSGCAALTGVEAISNGVPAFKPPKSKNAATTLMLLGGLAIVMLVGIIVLSKVTHLQYVEDPLTQIVSGPPGYEQKTVTAQLGETVFGAGSFLLYVVGAVTALILFLAANTAFNGFPVLGSILAQDRYLPRQLHTRGDRLAFSNGIIFLAIAAIGAGGRVPGGDHPADPALHRGRVRLVHAVPGRHDPALEPAAAHPARPDPAAPDDPVPGDQRVRHGPDRGGAGRRAGHQVPARRLDRDRRHGRSST